MLLSLTFRSLQLIIFGALLCLFSCSGTDRSPLTAEAIAQPSCGPEMTPEQLTHIAEEAIRAIGHDPSRLAIDYKVRIRSEACEYVFSAIPIALVAGGQIVMRIDREGRVKTFPWCCALGYCPEVCSAAPNRID